MISSSGLLPIPTLNTSSGAAAYLATSTLSMFSLRSGMRTLPNARSFLECAEKPANFAPYIRPAREAMPISSNQADQFVAFIDGNKVVLRGNAPAVAHSIDQQ